MGFQHIVEKILDHCSGALLTALQYGGAPILANIIQQKVWLSPKGEKRLKNHWDNFLPTRIRTERQIEILSVAQADLQIFIGLKSGLIEAYDQSLLLQEKMEKHTREVISLAISSDILVSIGKDLAVCTWNVKTKTLHCSLKLASPGLSCTFQADSLFIGHYEGEVSWFHHLGKGHLMLKKRLEGHKGKVAAMDCDTKFLVTGGHDKVVKVWGVGTGSVVRDLRGHLGQITCVRLLFPLLATGARGAERAVRIWNLQTGACLRELRLENNVRCLSLDATRLVTGDDDGFLVFWDMKACLDPNSGPDRLSYRAHNTYVEGHCAAVEQIGPCLLLSASGQAGQLTLHDYWAAAVEDPDHTDSW